MLSLGAQAHALQVLEASDGVAVEAVISIKEPTRIRIEGSAITDLFGNIHSSHCGTSPATPMTPDLSTAGLNGVAPTGPVGPLSPVNAINPAGEVVLMCDRDKGEVYVRPVGGSDKPINLFVSSATATYTLVLRRADTPADTLLIRDKTPQVLRRPTPTSAATSESTRTVEPLSPAPSHIRAMKALLVAMASDRVPPGMRVEESMRPVTLWTQAKFWLLRLYEGRGMTGELYALQNMSDLPMVLAEQEFDRAAEADRGEVTGVAIDRHNLLPGESTRVYVIRRGVAR